MTLTLPMLLQPIPSGPDLFLALARPDLDPTPGPGQDWTTRDQGSNRVQGSGAPGQSWEEIIRIGESKFAQRSQGQEWGQGQE